MTCNTTTSAKSVTDESHDSTATASRARASVRTQHTAAGQQRSKVSELKGQRAQRRKMLEWQIHLCYKHNMPIKQTVSAFTSHSQQTMLDWPGHLSANTPKTLREQRHVPGSTSAKLPRLNCFIRENIFHPAQSADTDTHES